MDRCASGGVTAGQVVANLVDRAPHGVRGGAELDDMTGALHAVGDVGRMDADDVAVAALSDLDVGVRARGSEAERGHLDPAGAMVR